MFSRFLDIIFWIRWKLFADINQFSCNYVSFKNYLKLDDYRDFIRKNYLIEPVLWHFESLYPYNWKEKRREAMFRFFVKGER